MEAVSRLISDNSQVTYKIVLMSHVPVGGGGFGGGVLRCQAGCQCCVGPLGRVAGVCPAQDLEEGSDQVHPRKTLSFGETFLFSEYGAWALVTGCTRGIGREYALGLAR